MKIYFSIFALLFSCFCYGSNSQIDSLKNLLNTGNKSKKEIAALLNKIGLDYSFIDVDSSKKYLKKAFVISSDNNLQEELSLTYHNYGEYHLHRGNYDSTRFYLNKAIALRKELQLKTGLSQSYNAYGESYRLNGNYEKALKNYLSALKLAPDKSQEAASAMSNLGLVYIKLNKLEEATQSFKNAIEVFKLAGSVQLVASCYNNLAMVEFYRSDYEKAVSWLKEALKIHIEHNNINGQAICYSNIGSTLLELGEYDEAKTFLVKGLEKFKKLGSKDMINTQQINIGYLHLNTRNYDQAETYLKKGLKEAKDQNNKELIKYATSYLSELYTKTGNHKKANEFLLEYVEIKDSLVNEKNSKALAELEAKFKKEQREKRIASLELEKKNKDLLLTKNKVQKNLITGGGLLALALMVFMFFYWKKRKESISKDLKLEKERISGILKKKEIETNSAIIEGQEEERKRIAKDLHDRVGSMLSTAKLHFTSGNEKSIQKANELLDETVQEVRRISHNLSSASLVEFGLENSLQELCQTVDSEKIKVQFFSHGLEKRLPSKIEIILYRCVQELISNVIKHSEADQVTVQLHQDEVGLNLMVEDNGVGFNPGNTNKGLGLNNIEERISSVNGKLTIDSHPKRGTNIIINIPSIK